jgi:hypothetical protein
MPKNAKKSAKKSAKAPKKSAKRTSEKATKSAGIAPLAKKVSSIDTRLGKVESVLGPQFKEFVA